MGKCLPAQIDEVKTPDEKTSMDQIEIKDWYEHENKPSVFIMFTQACSIVWSFSGNELRKIYLLSPSDYISGPIEVTITPELEKLLSSHTEDF